MDLAAIEAAWQELSFASIANPEAEGWLTCERYGDKFNLSPIRSRSYLNGLVREGRVEKLKARYNGRMLNFYRPVLKAR